jgi:hypothetical protein
MRRAADLYPGEAKTDRRDAYVIADTARTRRKQVHWLDTDSDELLERLRVPGGFHIDLAADQTRLTNRLRDALSSISPARQRAVGSRNVILAMLRTGESCRAGTSTAAPTDLPAAA